MTELEPVSDIRVYSSIWSLQATYWKINADSTTGVSITDVSLFDPLALMNCIFNILFAIQVIRFCRGETSKRLSLSAGILSLAFPIFLAYNAYSLYVLYFIERTGLFVYLGPIPIQLIIGLIIMRYAEPWSVTQAWDEEERSQDTWWKEESNSTSKDS